MYYFFDLAIICSWVSGTAWRVYISLSTDQRITPGRVKGNKSVLRDVRNYKIQEKEAYDIPFDREKSRRTVSQGAAHLESV